MNIGKNAGEMAQGCGLRHFLSEKSVIHLKTADTQEGTVRGKKRKQQKQYLVRCSGQDKDVTDTTYTRLSAGFPGVISRQVLRVKFQRPSPMRHDMVCFADFGDSVIEKELGCGVGRALSDVQSRP